MSGRKKALIVPAVLLALAAILLPAALRPVRSADDSTQPPAAMTAGADGEQPLFPSLKRQDILSLSISTPEHSFSFDCADKIDVSVNGQQADGEVFSTLLDQIMGTYYDSAQAETPRAAPVLTLTVSTQLGAYNARFYTENGRTAHIITHAPGCAQTLVTEAWRVGTMLLTCEGTRIFDANGRETPAD